MRDVQNWLWYRKETQRALRRTGVVQMRGDHFDCEGLRRKLLPQPGWASLIQSFGRNHHWQSTGWGQGKDTKSQGFPCSSWQKKSDLRQGFSNLIMHTNDLFGASGRISFGSGVWFSRSGLAWDPAFLTSPQVMLVLLVRHFEEHESNKPVPHTGVSNT